MCSLGSSETDSIEAVVTVVPLAVCVLMYGPDGFSGPLHRLEGIVWCSVLHVCRHGSSSV